MIQEQNQTIQNNIQGETSVNSTLRYAGFGARLGANLLDMLALIGKTAIVFFVLIILQVIIKVVSGKEIQILQTLSVILPILMAIFGIIVYRGRKDPTGSTFGRKKTNTIVLNEDGTNITKGKAFGRQLLYYLLNETGFLVFINVMLILKDDKKQSLVDKILKTVVVYK